MTSKASCWQGVPAAMAVALLSACASPPALPPVDGLVFRPVMRSTLVSDPGMTFVLAMRRPQAGTTVALLARQSPGMLPRPVAQWTQTDTPDAQGVSVQWFPEHDAIGMSAGPEVATIEQLYASTLKLNPRARYCWSTGPRPCDPRQSGVEHAEFLRTLADARRRLGGQQSSVGRWQVVALAPPPMKTLDADVARVQVRSKQGPLPDVSVYFDRAPHSLCHARTDAQGVAECRLVDQKGDEHTHDHSAPIVATFPGGRNLDRVLLPTTAVLSPPPQATRATFAKPLFP